MQVKKTKAEQICSYLLEEINSGNIKPGERLLSERDLSAKLGVSRMPLREALRALCNMGVLITKRGGGTFVAKKNNINKPKLPVINSNNIAVMEVLQVRTVIEAEAARLAATNATSEEIEIIRLYKEMREVEIKKQLLDEVSESDAVHTADTRFHRAIVEASHNSVFIEFLDSIMSTLAVHQRQASYKPDMFEHSTMYHQKIYDAIAKHNPETASEMMRRHIEDVGSAIKESSDIKKVKK